MCTCLQGSTVLNVWDGVLIHNTLNMNVWYYMNTGRISYIIGILNEYSTLKVFLTYSCTGGTVAVVPTLLLHSSCRLLFWVHLTSQGRCSLCSSIHTCSIAINDDYKGCFLFEALYYARQSILCAPISDCLVCSACQWVVCFEAEFCGCTCYEALQGRVFMLVLSSLSEWGRACVMAC